ncbi:hypothetical protein EJV47_03305 [Hymenobacter gummosus]|uniref:Uncharacterized protein n=1 Tax=Hymenobacter gummosus TaxID=1776032 RepID=A0A3S0K9A5_9BACT|nr:hypothetical protein [Hymenobacter gummosus]RTQ53775.1 hypothetical protein EJV47_03305 [Hymenobacter gummosus]
MFLELTWPAPKVPKAHVRYSVSATEPVRADAAPPAPNAAAPLPASVYKFQIGDFILGEADCPSLTGHPYIRY